MTREMIEKTENGGCVRGPAAEASPGRDVLLQSHSYPTAESSHFREFHSRTVRQVFIERPEIRPVNVQRDPDSLQGNTDPVAEVHRLELSPYLMEAVRPAPEYLQKKVDLCGREQGSTSYHSSPPPRISVAWGPSSSTTS
jgi:hypothetical protein